MNNTFSNSIANMVEEVARLQVKYKERALAEIITKYDFIVGSIECKRKLMEVLPEGANIVCSPYIENPTTIYAIKKFGIMDFIGAESEDKLDGDPIGIDKAVEHYEGTLEVMKGIDLEVGE